MTSNTIFILSLVVMAISAFGLAIAVTAIIITGLNLKKRLTDDYGVVSRKSKKSGDA